MSRDLGCHLVELADGTRVRVRGPKPGPEEIAALQEVADELQAHWATLCHDLSPFPMPEVAQRAHGRETYWCGRTAGHEPPHRWPADGTRFVWGDRPW